MKKVRMDHFGDGISKTADIFLGGGYAPGALGRVPQQPINMLEYSCARGNFDRNTKTQIRYRCHNVTSPNLQKSGIWDPKKVRIDHFGDGISKTADIFLGRWLHSWSIGTRSIATNKHVRVLLRARSLGS